jgi:transcription elongation GreA/GreB family factor
VLTARRRQEEAQAELAKRGGNKNQRRRAITFDDYAAQMLQADKYVDPSAAEGSPQVGFGCIVALYHRSSTSYQIR